VIVNKDTNKTITTTKTNLEFQTNGTLQVGLTRTDTNAAGTVTDTAWAPGQNGSSVVVAYPTPALALGTAFGWRAVLPTLYNGSVCCESQDTSSATPSHTIFATPTGSTNTIDPSGWLYTLINVENVHRIGSVEISSLWAGDSIGFPYTGCPYVSCNLPATTVAGAVYASSVAYLFATTTITTSGPTSSPLSTATPTGSTSSEHTTVEVDPIAAKPTGSIQASSGSFGSEVNPSTIGATVIQPPASAPDSAQQATTQSSTTETPAVQSTPSAPSVSQQATTQPLLSTETRQSQTTQAALPSAPSESPSGESVGEKASGSVPSAIISTHATSNPPAQTPAPESPSTFQSPSSTPATPVAFEPNTPSIAQLVTTSFTLVLVSSVASGEASSTTTLVLVTRPPGTTLQVGISSVDSQASNAVVVTESPTNPGQTTISSAALPQDTASSQQFESGSSDKVNGGDSPTTKASSTGTVAAIVIGGSTIAPDASSQYIVSGQSLLSGSSITLVQGSSTAVISLPTDQPEGASSPVAPIVVGSSTITPDASSNYVISGQTLAAGSKITLVSESSSAVIALQTSGSHTYLVVGSSSSLLPEQIPITRSAVPIVVGTDTIQPDASSNYIISGQTLAAGSEITLVSGSSSAVIALQTSDSKTYLVVGSSTSVLPEQETATRSAVPIVVGTNTIQPDASSNYIISGQTLAAGSEVTLVSGSSTAIVALKTSNSRTYLVIGTLTSMLPEQTASEGDIQPPAFTIGSSVITPNSASEYVIASQTLRPGAAITVSGSIISLASHATEIVIGTSTQTAAYNQGFGGYVWSALGGGSMLTSSETASGGSSVSSAPSTGSPRPQTNGVASLTSGSSASGADSVLTSASGTSSVFGTDIVSSSPSGTSTNAGGRGPSVTSTPTNSGAQTTSTSGAAQLRSIGFGLAALLPFIFSILEYM
jgi:hypothetical protein